MNGSQAQKEELAYATLLLERQLDSYQKLHEEEMTALRQALAELKQRILKLASLDDSGSTGTGEAASQSPLEREEE